MREVVMGNGSLLVNFDRELNLRDLYWPYGGFENHGDGNRTNFAVYVENRLSWFFENSWQREVGYVEDSPVTRIHAFNPHLEVELLISDAVHPAEDFYLKQVTVKNSASRARDLKLIFYQDFSIHGIEAGDSAVYDPNTGGIYQFKKGCYILANCYAVQGGTKEYSTGVKRYRGKEGTYRDAEDGYLSGNPIADGPVDSALGVSLHLEAGAEETVYYWLILGHNLKDVRTGNRQLLNKTPQVWLNDIVKHYRCWLRRQDRDYGDLEYRVVQLFKHSLLNIRSQVNRKGAVVASSDADTFLVSRDHYMYLWPRDGAMVAHAMDLAGYPEDTRKFYTLCARLISEEGYFLQRYNPDGSTGCTWHPWVIQGKPCLPIQEDETALVIWALGEHFRRYPDLNFLSSVFKPLIKPAVSFMMDYMDPALDLPRASWDLWEERRGVYAFTCGAVYGALTAGEQMAEAMGDEETRARCHRVSGVLRKAIVKHFYRDNLGRFIRGFSQDGNGNYHLDLTPDSSLYGLHAFGAIAPDDPLMENTMQRLRQELWVETEVGGMARYTNDYYHQVTDNIDEVPGNPWILTTLWLADWYVNRAASLEDLRPARELILWAADRAVGAGALPEQLHPYTGEPLSVVPLTWSHSTFVKTVLTYLEKRKQLSRSLH